MPWLAAEKPESSGEQMWGWAGVGGREGDDGNAGGDRREGPCVPAKESDCLLDSGREKALKALTWEAKPTRLGNSQDVRRWGRRKNGRVKNNPTVLSLDN